MNTNIMNTNKLIIGISGRAGSGKDTVASFIDEKVGWKFQWCHTLHFATPVKDIICSLTGWDERHRNGYLKEVKCAFSTPAYEECVEVFRYFLKDVLEELQILCIATQAKDLFMSKQYISPREAYQKIGTDICRGVEEDIWVNCLKRDAERKKGLILIPDVRFENEAAWVRENGHLINIVTEDRKSGEIHSSELGIKGRDKDFSIGNCSNLSHLNKLSCNIADYIVNSCNTKSIDSSRGGIV